MGDKTVKIFLNSKGKANDVNKDLLAFLNYVAGKKSDNPLVEALDNGVQKVKRNKEWRSNYMRYEEHVAAEAHLRALDMAGEMAKKMAEKMAGEMAEKMAKEMTEKAVEDVTEKAKEEKFEMIKNFLAAGASIDLVQKATGWSKEQIIAINAQ